MSHRNSVSASPTPPGASIRHMLDDAGMSQREFAELIEKPAQFVSELLNGKRPISVDTARRLEAALGPSAEFWMRREANYRLRVETSDTIVIERIRSRARAA
ncbi:MAG TPA: HigA family addiction module antitoxin [Fimbriimonas sp.]|nr:HigA family addiction module antitoxin [Fimbriimonas sp.]